MIIKPLTQGRIVKNALFENCRIVETIHVPKISYNFHAHSERTVTFIINGSFLEEFCGIQFKCNQFDLLYKPRYTEHRNEYYQSGAHSLLIEFFDNTDTFTDKSSTAKFIPFQQKEFAQSIALRLYSFLESNNPLVSFAAEELAIEFFKSDTKIEYEKKMPEWLTKTRDYLEAHKFENISLSKLSYLANVHPVYYARCFRRFFGSSVSQYIHKKRLSESLIRLINRTHSISEIAYDLGYTDQSHFTHFFKKELGFTPNTFSKKFRSYKRI